jgi:starch-binding outer membrane protein, SusD/RagB family
LITQLIQRAAVSFSESTHHSKTKNLADMNSKYLNKFSIVTIVVIVFMTAGCKKYLDQQPTTEVGADQVFKDVPTTLQALAGVYNRLTGDNGFGNRLATEYDVDNDLVMGPSGSQDDRRALAHYNLTALNSDIKDPFNQMFEGIMLANICIDKIPGMDMYKNGSEQQKAQLRRMYGEALTLRAQFYFEAIRNWGDVPAHFLPSYVEATGNPYPSRVDRDTLYNHILNDLKDAEAVVPWRNEVTSIGDQVDERITKGTVKGLRARIALFRGGFSLRQDATIKRGSNYQTYYQIARDETNDIINSGQHSLYPNYKNLWKDVVCGHQVGDPNGELMFQATAIGASGTADSKLGYANGPRVNGNGTSLMNPLPQYLYLFDSTDTRRDVTIAPYDVGVDGITKVPQKITNMRDGKYRRDWIKNPTISPTDKVQYFGLKWQILRYSDVLLMFAEAENELNGPTSAAYNALNMVRRRGFGKPINTADASVDLPIGASKDSLFKYIVRERALELGGEGVRKYDMLRWNLMATGLTESKAIMTNMSNRTGMISFSYMAGPPSYAANIANLPSKMYYRATTQADDASIWVNSYYKPSPTTAPSGTSNVNWVSSTIGTDITSVSRYAFGFVTGRSELLPIPQPARDANPNLSQNPGY